MPDERVSHPNEAVRPPLPPVPEPPRHGWRESLGFGADDKSEEPKKQLPKGEAAVEAVKQLASDLAKPAGEMKFNVGEPTHFGLELECFDPESGVIVVAARPRRRDAWNARVARLEEGEVMLTVEQVVKEIEAARKA